MGLRLVVLGGSFAGLTAASFLEPRLGDRAEVMLSGPWSHRARLTFERSCRTRMSNGPLRLP
jgi:hypothetical protein